MAQWEEAPVVNAWEAAPVATVSGNITDPNTAAQEANHTWGIAVEQDLPLNQAQAVQSLAQQPTGVIERAKSLASRLGKQFYNRGIADVVHTLGKSDQDPAWNKAQEIQDFRQKQRIIDNRAFSTQELNDEFDHIVKLLRIAPDSRPTSIYPGDPLGDAPQFLPKDNPLAATVTPPQGKIETGIDVGTGVLSFWAQTVLLKKAAPSLPDNVTWETVNQASGGPIGAGALMHGTLTGVGNVATKYLGAGLASQTAAATATSGIFGITTYLGGGNTDEILVNMGIPFAFGAAGITKAAWARYGSKDLAIQAIRERAPALRDRSNAEINEAIETTLTQENSNGQVQGQEEGQVSPTERGAESTTAPAMAEENATAATRPRTPENHAQQPVDIEEARMAVIRSLQDAQAPRDRIEAQQTEELGRRAALASQAVDGVNGEQKMNAALSQMRGQLTEYTSPDFTPLRNTLSQPQIDALYNDIWQRPHSPDFFDKLNTSKAFETVVDGFVPTRGEMTLLEKQFGGEFVRPLLNRLPLSVRLWDNFADVGNLMRTLVAGGDVSVAGRQLRVLGNTPQFSVDFAKAVGKGQEVYWKTLFGKGGELIARDIRQQYEASQYHREAKQYIEFFEPAGTISVAPERRPEFYVSNIPEKIPLVGRLIRAGNHNYVETTNMFMQAVWDKLRAQDIADGRRITKKDLKQRGNWLMAMSGRSKLPKGTERVATVLGSPFFAPRFSISRFTTPAFMAKMASNDPVARAIGRQSARSFASFIATNVAIIGLVKAIWGDKVSVEMNPKSADFAKLRIGNTRIDLWAGYIQAVRFLTQITTGEYKTAAGKIKERGVTDTVGRFIRTKFNPMASMIADIMAGQTFSGDKPFSPPKGEAGKTMDEMGVPKEVQGISKEVYNRAVFLWVQDFMDAWEQENIGMALTTGALSWAGINTSTYPETAYTTFVKYQDNIAQLEYGKNWEDLSQAQTARILKKYRVQLDDGERKVKLDQNVDSNFEYVGNLIEEEKKAGKAVLATLSPENQQAITDLGIQLGMSRAVGDWKLNNDRFKEYQDVTGKFLDERLTVVRTGSNWSKLTPMQREKAITNVINKSKEYGRKIVARDSNKQ